MLESVLVANRGEIAVRIVRACRDAGVRSIAVYSDADAAAEHVLLADEAVRLGAAEVHESYLSMDRVIDAAKASNAAAIHPGYGLLSENGEFATRVAAAGIVFIGPTPEVIELLGDKRTAREQAEAVGLSVLPAGMLAEGGDAAAVAGQIGYPLLVKAAFGGGGRGMRIVERPDQLADALAQAGRENEAAFGRADVYLERFLPKARHVEVQILSDTHGNVRHLGTRDCSTQRRNQKLIEEAPAFGLSPEVQEQAVAGSLRLARAVGYHGAATVEFLVGHDTAELFFLEVNTRVQVEHTVTEMVTGIDIVAAQLAIASGQAIPFTQSEVQLRGHAIEARLNAEDPATGFLPQTGVISRLRLPAGPWIRTDAGVTAGSIVSKYYDSLLAKVTAWGPDRESARLRLVRALAETVTEGVPTTTGFLTRVLLDDRFRTGAHWTSMVDSGVVDTSGPDTSAAESAPPESAHRAVRIRLPVDEIRLDIPIQIRGTRRAARATGTFAGPSTGTEAGGGPIGGLAPMDAVLIRHTVEVGEQVEGGTTVAVIESMKMETHVLSGTAGVVTAVHASAGDSLRRGDRLVTVVAT